MRRSLLTAMLALAAVLGAAVWLGSPHAPAIEPAPEDIGVIWAIEDAREESGAPLVTALALDGMPLEYYAQANTFYCTLGLGQGESWPQLRLTAPDAAGVRLRFTDDYTYDGCADAIREGYAYEIIAYTDEAYSYANVVFTGLPVLQLYAEETIGEQEVQAEAVFSAYAERALRSPARVHLRGDSSLAWTPKGGYKVEFTRGAGRGKTPQRVAGLCETDELVLLPLSTDATMMRDRLSWELVNRAFDADEGFGGLPSQYVEVYVNDGYQGVYLMLKPYDAVGEMSKEGTQAINLDSLYRMSRPDAEGGRPAIADPTEPEATFELFYAPDMERGFDGLQSYLALMGEEDDEAFARKALACLDMDSLLRYMLIVQAGCMVDNVTNNMYIWAHSEDGAIRYRFAFWDMDLTWGIFAGEEGDRWVKFPLADRVLALDVGGARRRTQEIWETLKARGLTAETVEKLIAEYANVLEESGAFARDARRWGKTAIHPDGYEEIVGFASARFQMMDDWVRALVP